MKKNVAVRECFNLMDFSLEISDQRVKFYHLVLWVVLQLDWCKINNLQSSKLKLWRSRCSQPNLPKNKVGGQQQGKMFSTASSRRCNGRFIRNSPLPPLPKRTPLNSLLLKCHTKGFIWIGLKTSKKHNKYILTTTDAAMKYSEAKVILEKEVFALAKALLIQWIFKLVTLKKVLTATGEAFCNKSRWHSWDTWALNIPS